MASWLARSVLFLLAATGAAAQPALEAWPKRAVQLVVPSPSGSGIDLVARALAERLALRWGQSVVVVNRPGANSIIGTEYVAKAEPDGHTLLFCSDAPVTVNPHLYKLSFDPLSDLAPVALIATFHQLLVTHASLPARTMEGFVAAARAEPGRFTYASFGAGSTAHLMFELLKKEAGIDLLHVPYKGLPQSVAAVASGEAMLTFAGVYSTLPHLAAGRMVALGFAAPKRSPFVPDVPTMGELGYPSIEYTAWFGVFAPAATPPAVVLHVHRAIADVLAEPGFRDRELLARGYEPSSLSPEQFAVQLRRESAARASLVKLSGARVE